MIEREISECGYRVTSVSTPFHALEMIVRTQPDLVIISAVLADLSGVDLAAGLKAMPQTRNTGMALITSYAREHDSLKYLPSAVPIIRKGASFADDLTSALNDQFII
ncbi:PleD family two-component system response regulator [Fodinicurvata halophila]